MANRLKMATVQSILTLHERGWSGRRIARELDVDRETVSRYVQLDQQSPAAVQARWRDFKTSQCADFSSRLTLAVEPSLAPVEPTGPGRRSDCERRAAS